LFFHLVQISLKKVNDKKYAYEEHINHLDYYGKEALNLTKKEEVILLKEMERLTQILTNKNANLISTKTFILKFGVNLNYRAQDGFFFYSQNRLVIMNEKTPKTNQVKPEYSGIVGIVDIPYSVMEPNQNKQRFTAEKEFQKLKQIMLQHMEHYYFEFRNEIKRITKYEKIDIFWNDMGYPSYYVDKPYDSDPISVKRRLDRIKPYIQCDKCLKFLRLPNRPSDVGRIWPDDTVCSHLPNENCKKPKEIVEFKEIVFTKKIFEEASSAGTPSSTQISGRVSLFLNDFFW
jgi:hypothetical protein